MLGNAKLHAVLSGTDLDRMVKFYTEVLGLRKVDVPMPEGHAFLEAGSGAGLTLYQRSEPPKAENTAAEFEVDNLEQTMEELRAKGVKFEEYDFPGLKTVNGIAQMGPDRGAWFKDTEGNIIAIGDRSKS